MTAAEFESLLNWLSPVRAEAGDSYEACHHLLIRFFEVRGFGDRAAELADIVFDTVGRKLAKGDTITTENQRGYLYSVAKNVLRDHWKKPVFESMSGDNDPGTRQASSSDRNDPRNTRSYWEQWRNERESLESKENLLRCLEECLQQLPPETRTLIVKYYEGEKQVKIRNRQRLAEDLRITLNSLAIRVLRLRSKLEACIRHCTDV